MMRSENVYEPEYGDPKPMGQFGAPRLRCTSGLIALCVVLVGLVLAGVGAVMAAFWNHEALTKYGGITLVVLGALMIIGGVILFFFDHFSNSSRRQTGAVQWRNGAVAEEATITLNANSGASGRNESSTERYGGAPPPYETVVSSDPLAGSPRRLRPSAPGHPPRPSAPLSTPNRTSYNAAVGSQPASTSV